jgi:uncharacterized protein
MATTLATTNSVPDSGAFSGNLCAEVRETHTGLVVLVGDKAYKVKKPGTGKTTLAHALAANCGAGDPTDDVRQQLLQVGTIAGTAGVLDEGLYTAENVAAVYDALLRYPHDHLRAGQTVILDATWRDVCQRGRARKLADETDSPIVDFTCRVPMDEAAARIQNRPAATSDATPQIAAALAEHNGGWFDAHPIDTGRPLADSVAEAMKYIVSLPDAGN